MASAVDHGRKVLAAILPDERDRLDLALRYLVAEHFLDPIHSKLFLMLERYAEVTGSVMSRDALDDLVHRATSDVGRAALYVQTFEDLVAEEVDAADFRWSMQELRDLAAERETMRALTEGVAILNGVADMKKGEELHGHEDAWSHVLTAHAEIERNMKLQDAPEGALKHEQEEMLQDYADRKRLLTSGKTIGVRFGLESLDRKIGGLQAGDFGLIAGYSSDGKTSLVVQLAWSAAIQQGKNVVIATTETTRAQVRRKLIARHSVLDQFGLVDGLNSRALRDGSLSEEEERVLPDIVADLSRNPAYGEVYIAQVPRAATLSQLEARLYRINRQFPIDMVCMDYLALLRSDRKRDSVRDELGALMRESKQIATTFDDGHGLVFVSPWQVNRTWYDNAIRTGFYTTLAMSETAEATNSPDIIVSVLNPTDSDTRMAELKLQLLKNRDGETAGSLAISVDYATCNFFERTSSTGMEALLSSSSDEYGSLLG